MSDGELLLLIVWSIVGWFLFLEVIAPRNPKDW